MLVIALALVAITLTPINRFGIKLPKIALTLTC